LRSGESFRLAALDLPAVACTLIDDDRPQAGIDERFRSAHPGRAGTDDDQAQVGHDASGCSVRMERPALTGVSHARSRSPVPVQTQQS
jgi:hypothetical protein